MIKTLKEKLNTGESVYGVWSVIAAPTINEIIALSGFDFQILDMEHGTHDVSTLEGSIRACELWGCSPLVRLPSIDQGLAQVVLDLGVAGLVIPQVKNFAQAEAATKLLHYAPDGDRGFNPFTRGNLFNIKAQKKSDLICGIIIENKTAFADLDKILTLKKLDVIYLGAYDMSVALGKPGDMSNPELLEFIDVSLKKITAAGKVAGLMADVPSLKAYQKQGAQFLVRGVDSYLIGENLKKMKSELL